MITTTEGYTLLTKGENKMKNKKVEICNCHTMPVIPGNMHKSVATTGVLSGIVTKVLKSELDKFFEDMKPTEFTKEKLICNH